MATTATAQWDTFDKNGPNALELAASALHQTERWSKSASQFAAVLRKDPAHPTACYFLAHALAEQGDHDGVEEVDENTPDDNPARALVYLELARARAQKGFAEAALEALEKAHAAQLVYPRKQLEQDAKLRTIRHTPRFKAVLADVAETEKRFLALVAAGDRQGIQNLVRANSCLWWPKLPTNLYLFKAGIRAHRGRANRTKKVSQSAEKLMGAAVAADEALAIQRFVPWVEAALRWSKDDHRRHDKAWKSLKGYASLVRSHRFGKALDVAANVQATAEALGDLLLHYEVQRAAGLVHLATIDYKAPRKGVSREEEWRAARQCWLEYKQLAAELRCAKGLVDAHDFLATLEISVPHGGQEQALNEVHRGIVETARLAKASRELGMFEQMWRSLIERNQKGDGGR